MANQETTIVEANQPIRSGLQLHELLTNREDRLASALSGTGIEAGRFIEGVVQAIAKNPDLLKCTRESVLMACLEAAQIGLEPTGLLNQAWLVPYKTQARLMIGYAGYITLLDRSKSYDFIEARLVFEHDEFEWQVGTNPHITHHPADAAERGKFGHVRGGGYWVAWKRGSSRPQFDVMSFAEMEKRRKVSKRAEQDMWREWPEEMYRKTVLRWGLKSMPLTPIVQQAMAYEQMTDQLPLDAAPSTSMTSDRRRNLLDHMAGKSPDAQPDDSEPAGASDSGIDSEGAVEPVPVVPGQMSLDDGLPPMAETALD